MIDKLKIKDVIAGITKIFMLMFKLFIFASTMLIVGTIVTNNISFIIIMFFGIAWLLGLENVMLIYNVFSKKR